VTNCVSLQNTLVNQVRLDGTNSSNWTLVGKIEPFVTALRKYWADTKHTYPPADVRVNSRKWNLIWCTLLRNLGLKWNLAEITRLFIWRYQHLFISAPNFTSGKCTQKPQKSRHTNNCFQTSIKERLLLCIPSPGQIGLFFSLFWRAYFLI